MILLIFSTLISLSYLNVELLTSTLSKSKEDDGEFILLKCSDSRQGRFGTTYVVSIIMTSSTLMLALANRLHFHCLYLELKLASHYYKAQGQQYFHYMRISFLLGCSLPKHEPSILSCDK